jgi:hypothetical protein
MEREYHDPIQAIAWTKASWMYAFHLVGGGTCGTAQIFAIRRISLIKTAPANGPERPWAGVWS